MARREGFLVQDYSDRFYDPTLGRFIQPDTVIPNTYGPQHLNRYTYVTNDPIAITDPSGHRGCDEDGWCEGGPGVPLGSGSQEGDSKRHKGGVKPRDILLEAASRLSDIWDGVISFSGRVATQLPLELGAGFGETGVGLELAIPGGLIKSAGRIAGWASVLLQMAPAQIDNFSSNQRWGQLKYDVAADAIIDAGIVVASTAAGAATFAALTGASLGIGTAPAALAAVGVAVAAQYSLNQASYRSGVRAQLTSTLTNWGNSVSLVPHPAAPAVPVPIPSIIGTPGP